MYFVTAFQCVADKTPFHIPKRITAPYVIHAEEIINMSYSHSETVSSVRISFSELHMTSEKWFQGMFKFAYMSANCT